MPGSWSDFLKLRWGPAPPPSPEAGAVRVYADAAGSLRTIQPDGTDAAVGGGGGGSTPVQSATAVLAQADILALPTTDVTLVPGQADKMVVPIWAALRPSLFEDYSNFNGLASMEIAYRDHAAITCLNFMDAFGPGSLSDYFIGRGDHVMTVLAPLSVFGASTDSDRTMYPEIPTDQGAAIGGDLVTYINNHGTGDLTGGDPEDVFTITVLYTVLDFS